MIQNAATTPAAYLKSLDEPRRADIGAVRKTILKSLPNGYEESMQFGMLSYCVPLKRYPNTYNGAPLMYAALAAQKNYNSLYLMGCYADEAASMVFQDRFKAAGGKANFGKACIRFKSLSDLPLAVVADSIAAMPVQDFIALYERVRAKTKKK